jgi:hypothetical protein
MNEYKCYDCGHIFKAKGKKKEYNDPIYGPCSKMIARCPSCGEEAIQHSINAGKSKKSSGAAPCGKYESCSCCGG